MQTVCPAVCRLLTAHCDPLAGVWVITAVLGQSPAWVPCCGWAEDAATRRNHPRGRGETRDTAQETESSTLGHHSTARVSATIVS